MNKITVLIPDRKMFFNSDSFDTFSGETVTITDEEIQNAASDMYNKNPTSDWWQYEEAFLDAFKYIKSRINQ